MIPSFCIGNKQSKLVKDFSLSRSLSHSMSKHFKNLQFDVKNKPQLRVTVTNAFMQNCPLNWYFSSIFHFFFIMFAENDDECTHVER